MAAAAAALALAGCGSEATRQDAADADGTYDVSVEAAFPARQDLAEESRMTIAVTNDGDETIPNVAATIEAAGKGTTVEAFGMHSEQPQMASTSRPVWIVQDGPLSGDTAYTNTWAIGPIEPGASKTFTWTVVAIRPGTYRVTYRLAGSLPGGARLVDADGGAATGSFDVVVSDKPGQARITDDGRIVRVPGR